MMGSVERSRISGESASPETTKGPSLNDEGDSPSFNDWIIGGVNNALFKDSSNSPPKANSPQKTTKSVKPLPMNFGFVNIGNTCYINAAIQALIHTPYFKKWMDQDEDHKKTCNDRRNCTFCALSRLLENVEKYPDGSFTPFDITSRLNLICPDFEVGTQQDGHEFFIRLLSSIEKSLEKANERMPFNHDPTEPKSVSQVFGGSIQSKVSCASCRRDSIQEIPIGELELEMNEATYSVDKAVRDYFKGETLEGYKCESCGSSKENTKKISMLFPPKVLCLYLKRFTGDGQKVDGKIQSSKILDLSKYLSTESLSKKLKYRMTTQIIHDGTTLDNGHYLATAVRPDGNFNLYDDSFVGYLPEENALFNDTFMAIYELEEEPCKPLAVSIQNTVRSVVHVNGSISQDLQLTTTKQSKPSNMADQLFIDDSYDGFLQKNNSTSCAVNTTENLSSFKGDAEHIPDVGNAISKVDHGQNKNLKKHTEITPAVKSNDLFTLFFPKKSRSLSRQKPAKKSHKIHSTITTNKIIRATQQEQQKSDPKCDTERQHADSKHNLNTPKKVNVGTIKDKIPKDPSATEDPTEKVNTRRSKRKLVKPSQDESNADKQTKNKDTSDGVSSPKMMKYDAKPSSVSSGESESLHCAQSFSRIKETAADNNADVKADSPFSCDVCGKVLTDEYAIRRHKKTIHSINIPYKCCFCEQVFDSYAERSKHRKRVHGRYRFKCTECTKSFPCLVSLNKHLVKHGIQPNYCCMECPDKFSTSEELKSHVDAKHPTDEKVSCKECGKIMNKKSLKGHMQTMHSTEYLKEWWNKEKNKRIGLDIVRKNKRLKSKENDVSKKSTAKSNATHSTKAEEVDATPHSSTNSDLKKQNTENNSIWFKCNYCEDYFNSIAERSAHEDTIHGKKAHVCNVCGKRYFRIYNLHKHLVDVHQQNVTISCHICDDVFSSNKEKQHHMKQVHGVKPYICFECNKGFDFTKYLKKHLFRTHGVKPTYSCTQCPKSFFDHNDLEVHMDLHKNGGIIQCEFCELQLTPKSLLAHLRLKHPTKCAPVVKRVQRVNKSEKRKEKAKQIADRENIARNVIVPDQGLKYDTADWFCSLCMKQFENEYVYQSHMCSVHRQKLKYKCEICEEVFESTSERKTHRTSEHGESPFACSHCPKKFKMQSALNRHIMDSHNVTKLQCSKCSFKTLTMEGLQDHHKKKHPAILTELCDYCPQKFTKRKPLNRHIRKCHPEVKLEFKGTWQVIAGQIKKKRIRSTASRKKTVSKHQQFLIVHGHKQHRCIKCGQSFHHKYILQRHIEAVHLKKRVYFCNVCNEKFRLPYLLRLHRERVHNEGEKYRCKVCPQKFGNRKALHIHRINEHDDTKISKCPQCDELFSEEKYVRLHIKRLHNPNNPYPCKLCKNAHLTCAALISHLRIAHGVQWSFVCDECPSQFERFIQLIKHRREVHTMLQEHHCDNCGKGFNTLSQLNIHTTQKFCTHCTYLFENDEEKLRHFSMHHNNFIFNRMITRQSHLMRNLKGKTLDQQREDFTEIYELSQELVPFCNDHRKLYGLVFVPRYVTKDNLKKYLNDSSNEMYFNIGKTSVGYERKTVSRHHIDLDQCSASMLRVNSGFRCFHIFDMWIGEISDSKELGALNYSEALNILKLLLFVIYYDRNDIFMQKLELDPLFKVGKHVIDELMEDVIQSKGNVLKLSGFGLQFIQEIKTDEIIEEKPDNAFTCSRCKSVHNLYTKSLRTRHEAKCPKRDRDKRPRNRNELLLSMIRISENKIVKILGLRGQRKSYCCYSITGIKKIRRSREAVLNYKGRAMKYHGQNSYGHVSRYHFNPNHYSTVRNLAKSGFKLYLMDIWSSKTERAMFQVEITLQIKEIIQSNNGSNTKLAYRHLKLYDVSVLFTLEEWLEILNWSHQENAESLPPFVSAMQKSTFKNITSAIRNNRPDDDDNEDEEYENDSEDDDH